MVRTLYRSLEDVRKIVGDLQGGGNGWILLTVAAGWSISIGVRFMFPPLVPYFQEEFGFGLTTAGFLLTSLWLAYALGQFPGGVLGDRVGEGNILVFSTAISAAAVLLVALSVNIWTLFGGAIVFGFATSLFGPTRFTIFTDIYSDRAGTAVGLSHASGSVGNTILPALAVTIASYTSWRLGFGVLAPVFLLVSVLLWLKVPARTSATTDTGSGSIKLQLKEITSNILQRGVPLLVVVQIILVFTSQGFIGFYPTYLIEIKGFSPQIAAVLFGAYFAVGIVVQAVAGLCNDRFGPRSTLALLTGMFFIGLVTLYVVESFLSILALTLLLSQRNGTGVVTNTYIADALPNHIKGSGLGMLRTFWMVIGATSPIFVGYLGDQGLLRITFLLLAGLVGAAVVLSLFLPDP